MNQECMMTSSSLQPSACILLLGSDTNVVVFTTDAMAASTYYTKLHAPVQAVGLKVHAAASVTAVKLFVSQYWLLCSLPLPKGPQLTKG